MYLLAKIIRKIVGIPAIKNASLDSHTKIDQFSTFVNSTMGKYSYIGEHTSVINTTVGVGCSISNYCAIGGGGHPMTWVSISPIFNNTTSILHYRISNSEFNPFTNTVIGNDVWIGSHCLIKAGVTIGDGAVIGMGTVVTKNVGPYEIWAGNPAKFIRRRFDEETVQKLLQIKWWEWSEEKLLKYADDFCDIKKFLEDVDG